MYTFDYSAQRDTAISGYAVCESRGGSTLPRHTIVKIKTNSIKVCEDSQRLYD